MDCKQIGMMQGGKWDKMHEQSRRVYDTEYLAPCLHTCGGGNLEPKIAEPKIEGKQEVKIAVKEAVKDGYSIATIGDSINMAYANSKLRRGRVGHGVAQTIDTMPQQAVVIGGVGEKKSNNGTQYYLQDRIYDGDVAVSVTTSFNPYYAQNYRIRKLTPLECFRLMGFDDEDYYKVKAIGMSDSQIYKQAGNSIVVDVLEKIFGEML